MTRTKEAWVNMLRSYSGGPSARRSVLLGGYVFEGTFPIIPILLGVLLRVATIRSRFFICQPYNVTQTMAGKQATYEL